MKKVLKLVGTTILILAIIVGVILTVGIHRFKNKPELNGEPKIGKWYKITPEDALSANGSKWHGLIKIGIENKVILNFFGGGSFQFRQSYSSKSR